MAHLIRVTNVLCVALGMSMATSQDLGGEARFLTHISTDKPMYKSGEHVRVRGVMLDARNHKPTAQAMPAAVEIRGPKGDVVAGGQAQMQDSVWSFEWVVPESQAGGEYTIKASYPWTGQAPAERKFDIRAYRPPRLKSQIVFLRDGYGPGDKVTATLETTRAEGGIPSGAKVTAIARVDGAEVARVPAKIDDKGRCTVSFDLPKEIARGDGSLAFAIEDGGVVENATKTIPILLQTVDLTMFPEGGELVSGLSSRVYFEAKTPVGKPADLSGVVVSDDGAEVATFKSEHEGRGRFELTPKAGRKYALKIVSPSGIKTQFPLPEVKAKGAVLHAQSDVFEAGAPVVIAVTSTDGAKVTIAQREKVLDTKDAKAGNAELKLDAKDADGVLVVTAWKGETPLAERLVFRRPARALSVELKTDKSSYVPGEPVKLSVKTTSNGKPVSAVVGLTVTDDAVLELIEKREQAPQLPVMVLLEDDVRELADAHVYLDAKNPKAPLATDLLLGTQGWRRFALVHLTDFIAKNGDAARRALAFVVPQQIRYEDDEFSQAFGGAPGGPVARGAVRHGAMPPAPPQMMPRNAAPPPQAPPPVPAPVVVAKPMPAQPPPMAQPVAQAKPMPVQDVQMMDALRSAKEIDNKNRIVAKAEMAQVPARNDFVWVRDYAHLARTDRKPSDRVDFTETLYWSAATRTDAKGEATVSFAVNDSVTSFKASAGGFTEDGTLGSGTFTLTSVQPFYLEPKLPLEVTQDDVVQLPLALVNGTAGALKGATVAADITGDVRMSKLTPIDLSPNARVRELLELKIGTAKAPLSLKLDAKAGEFSDSVTRQLVVKPKGFPYEKAFGGLVSAKAPASHSLTIPTSAVPGSIVATAAVYPTPLANLTEALERLIRDPYGCFEQTSSTSYPLTMAQQYFLSHQGVDPKLVQASKDKLDASYKRLVGFECSDKGYEWFGENPGHEALTAYGLLHFTDMQQVRDVDSKMLVNTRSWLMKQRDGNGGFNRKRRALHTWVEDKDSSNAYITWALLESGEKDLGKEVGALKAAAAASKNSYVWALAANALWLGGDKPAAKALMEKLQTVQQKDGSVGGATQSIVGSGGESLSVETTSLAALAWMREREFAGNVETSIRYLADVCKGGRYGSTQSTVLALRAIVTYDKQRSRPKASGSLRIFVDGQQVGSSLAFDTSTQGALKLPDVAELLTPGDHRIELKMENGGEMPYALAVKYNAVTPASAKETKVDLVTRLSKGSVAEGETLEAVATVTNVTDAQLPTVVAIVGLPGGLEPRHDQLKELVKKGTVDAYEVIGREVVLYWRGMEKSQKREVPLSLVAAVPGRYVGPASRAYEYYTDEYKRWTEGMAVTITPK
jgi:hypothetical protein